MKFYFILIPSMVKKMHPFSFFGEEDNHAEEIPEVRVTRSSHASIFLPLMVLKKIKFKCMESIFLIKLNLIIIIKTTCPFISTIFKL